MKLRELKISNYRGVTELQWAIPNISHICLIGSGDSNKSTILEAIGLVFTPKWNPNVTDNDFSNSDVSRPIQIFATIGDLPEDFISRFEFGDFLSGWNKSEQAFSLEPQEGEDWELALRIRFSVADNLEPSWKIVRADDDEGIEFRAADRAKIGVSLIGYERDIHLTWSRHSVLNRFTDKQSISSSLAMAGRAAKSALDTERPQIRNLDEAAETAERLARSLGVRVRESYKAQLDLESIQLRQGGVALHDGSIPLQQLGLGSRRMLIAALQGQAREGAHITLFDEVEVGLEPNRIARLLQSLRDDEDGQFIMTTHSPVVLREMTVKNLFVVHADDHMTNVVPAAQEHIKNNIQGNIRSAAEAFLASKIVVCEGATEVGFLRGLDIAWIADGQLSCAYHGATFLDARGANKIAGIVLDLRLMQYQTAVFADADDEGNFSEQTRQDLQQSGSEMVVWSEELCLEQRVFTDLPWQGVLSSLKLAVELGNNAVVENVRSKHGHQLDVNFEEWTESDELRISIGSAAKSSDWFKRTDRGEAWAQLVFPYLEGMGETDLVGKIHQLRSWIDRV